MKKYIGTKIIEAIPGTMAEAQALKDGVPVDVKEEIFRKSGTADKDGYIVKYPDGYISWSPKNVFEEAYRRCDNMSFGLALEALKKGMKVSRRGWNGRGMYLYLVQGSLVDKENLINEASFILPKDDVAMHGTGVACFLSHIDMRTASGDVCIGWNASQVDMLADDWEIVE